MIKNTPTDTLLTGIIKRHPDGFGFFVSDNIEDPDVYVSRNEMTGVMTNDRVRLRIFPEKKKKNQKNNDPTEQRWRGEIEEIIERSIKNVVGVIRENPAGGGVVFDESFSWGESLHVDEQSLGEAEFDQLVALEITAYPSQNKTFSGRVLYVIGEPEDPLNDVLRIIAAHGIPKDFSSATLKECEKFAEIVDPKKTPERKDLQEKPFITIDGNTAKDFDDAVLVEQTDKGFTLYVAIADVSHYVKQGTKLNEEAYERGTSVYLPGTVVPMLPEALSNELCSLKPNVVRLAFTCEMQISFEGEVQKFEFYESIIRSHARVTYGQAQQVIDGDVVDEISHVKEMILRAADLSRILMAKRFKDGSLDLDVPETQVIVDEQGEPVDVVRADRIFAHRLIEELMLVTNICAATFFSDNEMAGLFRIHEAPDETGISLVEKFIHNFGGKKGIRGGSLQKKLTKALQDFAGKPEAIVLNMLTLRSMSQAKYSADNIGHFGLGFDNYSHFTSPIRRYPDLIIHRLIKSRIYPDRYRDESEEQLTTDGNFLSACEQRAVKAERQVVSIKKARFMQSHVGKEFEGVISSVAKFGVFVLLREFDIDGRVSMEGLGDDFWEFDEENLFLRGKRSGKIHRIGDKLKVVVSAVDVIEGKIDFSLIEEEVVKKKKSLIDILDEKKRGAGKKKSKKGKKKSATTKHGKADRPNNKKRRKTKKNRGSVR